MLQRRDTGLIGTQVRLADSCAHCRSYVVVRVAKADTNPQGCRYRFICVGCSKFRGYVSIDLEQHLTGILRRLGKQSLRPILLGKRKPKASHGSDLLGLADAE